MDDEHGREPLHGNTSVLVLQHYTGNGRASYAKVPGKLVKRHLRDDRRLDGFAVFRMHFATGIDERGRIEGADGVAEAVEIRVTVFGREDGVEVLFDHDINHIGVGYTRADERVPGSTELLQRRQRHVGRCIGWRGAAGGVSHEM